MRKLFLAICFNLVFLGLADAKIVEILDKANLPQVESPKKQNITQHNVTEEEFLNFLDERMNHVLVQSQNEVSRATTNAQPSEQAHQAILENQKSGFEKIYDEALKRLDDEDKKLRTDIGDVSYPNKMPPERTIPALKQSNVPTIKIQLPRTKKEILVPAVEHIPYLISNIEILPDGVVKFTETITVIANGQKLRKGLAKVLPKYVYSRQGKRQTISYNLVSVTINDENIFYHLRENKNRIFLAPKQEYTLAPGVYTFKFEYTADNLLWDYGSFKELYWDVTGGAWNMVVSRAGAMLNIPGEHQPLDQEILVGHPKKQSANAARIFSLSPQTWGYVASRELFSYESLYLIVSLPSDVVVSPSLGKRFMRHFNDYGDRYISFLCMVIIWGALILSWKYIRINKGQLKIALKKTAILTRYLVFNRYDLKSFGGFLLDMYRKNIIDIQQNEDTILLVKRTDNLKSLTKSEQKAINYLFTQDEPVLNVNKNNRLKIIRAARVLEKELRKSLFAFMLKLSGGYIFFSFGMLFLSELFISLLAIDTYETFAVLSVSTITLIFGVYIFNRQGWKIWQKWLFRVLGVAIIVPTLVIMAAVVSLPSVLMLFFSVIIIRHYVVSYVDRNGLLRKYIDEAVEQKNTLLKHKENILLGKEIINKQALIWVLDMEDGFISSINNEHNKLLAMKCFIKNQLR